MDEEQKSITEESSDVKQSIFDFDKIKEESKVGQRTESEQIQGLTVTTHMGDQFIIEFNGVPFGKMDGNGDFTYFNLDNAKKAFEDAGLDIKEIDLPELQQAIDLEEQAKKEQEQEIEDEQEQEGEKEETEENGEEFEEEEKDDEKPELEEEQDEKKEEIAKKYNLNANQVIHIAKDEKITENERFHGLVNWVGDRDDVYVIPGDDPYTYKFIGDKDGEQEEIEAGTNKVIGGKNPDVTIKRIDGENITEIKPLAMYEVDSETSIAIVKNEYGEPEALYCRQEDGNEKAYWGSVIPEASGKNVLQQEPEVRDFMDHKYNSGLDLSEKTDDLSRQEDLEKRGLPSNEKGVQVTEIEGNSTQNREKNKEEIIEDLMKKDGIVDRATVPPGYYEYKAEKVLREIENNENITYDQAVEQVEEEEKGPREEGGRTQGEQPSDPRR